MIRAVIAAGLALLCLSLARADSVAAPYLRFVENAQGASLQTAIVRFSGSDGVTVDLVGAIHIADKAYYQRLDQRFAQYDAVLYELVGGPMPEKTGEAEPKREVDARLAWLSGLQTTMKNSLQLSGQLEGINYHAKNFVHADMSTGEFFAAKEEKNESFLGLLMKAWKIQSGLADPEKEAKQPSVVRLMEILCRKDNASELKRLIGREFDSMGGLISGMEADGGTVVVGERNRVALEQMDKEIAGGRRRLAIFYGAAHLQDMEQKLMAQGFTRGDTEWLTAWDLPPEPVVEVKPAP